MPTSTSDWKPKKFLEEFILESDGGDEGYEACRKKYWGRAFVFNVPVDQTNSQTFIIHRTDCHFSQFYNSPVS
ncbi:MAG: hypothetical protein WCK65_12760, partial [Rhodospirillaceae bacterium]